MHDLLNQKAMLERLRDKVNAAYAEDKQYAYSNCVFWINDELDAVEAAIKAAEAKQDAERQAELDTQRDLAGSSSTEDWDGLPSITKK